MADEEQIEVVSDEDEAGDWDPALRPAWRYYTVRGWNILAIAWMIMGLLVAALADLVFSRWLRNEKLLGACVITGAVAVIVADLVCRARDKEPQGAWRYLCSDAGGSIGVAPAWLLAVGALGRGVTTWLKWT